MVWLCVGCGCVVVVVVFVRRGVAVCAVVACVSSGRVVGSVV